MYQNVEYNNWKINNEALKETTERNVPIIWSETKKNHSPRKVASSIFLQNKEGTQINFDASLKQPSQILKKNASGGLPQTKQKDSSVISRELRNQFASLEINPDTDPNNYHQKFLAPVILNTPWQYADPYFVGQLKFFDETQKYGFLTLDADGTDLFVHYDDLLRSGITVNELRVAKLCKFKFAFQCSSYYGKYKLSKKAVNIIIVNRGTMQFS